MYRLEFVDRYTVHGAAMNCRREQQIAKHSNGTRRIRHTCASIPMRRIVGVLSVHTNVRVSRRTQLYLIQIK